MRGPKGSALCNQDGSVFRCALWFCSRQPYFQSYDPSKDADVGHFLITIKPDLFMGLEDFNERMDYLYQRIVDCNKMAGVERIYSPDKIRQLTKDERTSTGIPYTVGEVASLNQEASKVGARGILMKSN